jgi:hypothetical protein
VLSESILIAAAAALGGLFMGGLGGSWITGRRMRNRVEEIGGEVVRMRRAAEDKLLEDDPNLPDLMRNLNTAVDQAYRAIDALENQSELTKRKTEGAKEVVAKSRDIIRMIEDMGADLPYEPPARQKAQKALTADAPPVEDAAETEEITAPSPSPSLR